MNPGTRLDHYEILASLGEGGMGAVYRARDTRLDREVAVKVLRSEVADNPEFRARFDREARAISALNHPNVCTLYDIGECDGTHFLVMEMIEGRPLNELIAEGDLSVERLLAIAAAMADALAAAHDKGLVHRDLKPANVVIGDSGSVKVLDFGLAKMTASGEELHTAMATEAYTEAGMVMGTAPYMSPEQISGRRVDHRTDVFSLGVVLYEMASGHRPFAGSSKAELASAILRDTPPVVTELRPDLPADFARIVRRCLEKSPDERLQTARDLGNELRDLTRQMATGSRPVATETGPAEREGGFWLAVLPFRPAGTNEDLAALADGLSEEIVAGLSRFSYLRVITHGATQRYADGAADPRRVGEELGARYAMNGTLRLSGTRMRIAVQLIDAVNGAQLWSESYERLFSPDTIFELQDDLVPRIVSTVADIHGVLPYSMREAVRLRSADEITPYEALLRSFGYNEIFTPEDFASVLECLERAVKQAPGHADLWAMLSLMHSNAYGHWGQPPEGPLDRALRAARTAVELAPQSTLPHYALAQALFFLRDWAPFRVAAERAVAINPMDGATAAWMGLLIAYSGDWERGCALADRAWELNPSLPGVYRYTAWHDAYGRGDYQAALDLALRIDAPENFYNHAVQAMCYAQLGQMDPAHRAVRTLLELRPDYAEVARDLHGRWIRPDLVEKLMEGLRKAGLDVPSGEEL